MAESKSKTVLVLGATGGIGGEVARRLKDEGWRVRAMAREVPEASSSAWEWIKGDAMRADDVLAAARGAAAIVHAVNPPGYRRWSELVLPMIDHTIAAAIAEGATIVLPGTVYNYGPDAFAHLDESAPQHPTTRKGRIRVELEQRLLRATEQGARAIVVRAGDFFGPRVKNSWFSQGLVQPGRPVATVRVPGAPGVGHQWAYLPDVAKAMAMLLDRREALAPFASFHMSGHWDVDGTRMAESIRRVAARHGLSPRVTTFPWWMVHLASPFVPTMRELIEMRYLWREPVQMIGTKLARTLGAEPHTPLDEAIEATLVGLGCLGETRTIQTQADPGESPALSRADQARYFSSP